MASLFSSETGGASSTRTAADGSSQSKRANGGKGAEGSSKRAPRVKPPTGEREPGITPERKARNTVARMTLESPAFVEPDGYHVALRTSATCEGKDVSPSSALERPYPTARGNSSCFVMSFAPVEGRIFFDWAVGGLDPLSTKSKKANFRRAQVLGRNSFGKTGYSICPPEGRGESYVFYLFALPKPLNPKPGFDPAKLREEALAEHASSGFLAVTYHVY